MRLFASSCLIFCVWIFSIPGNPSENSNVSAAPPCKCLKRNGDVNCPGQTRCGEGQWSICRCESSGNCEGECFTVSGTASELTRSVLGKITEETISAEDLFNNRIKYANILSELLGSNHGGVYSCTGRWSANCTFNDDALNSLRQVLNELRD